MGDIVVRVPLSVDEKLADLIAKTISERLKTPARLNEMLKNSELSEEDAVELGRKAKMGRGEYLGGRYFSSD
ncbi:hypothetical protein [Thermococcus sp. Bubb.Bath]|uniref:hypothetical protein n=1 Tax=Thermococcus sp. Bubb.Bath TaxID=1638242 RepID=UPI0014390613|nr:hypothetical protein [Thermococcus sp. Bubb.Bath]NJF25525.1 hypothetical protein [Thermococcus sp. Bubb.Bath]